LGLVGRCYGRVCDCSFYAGIVRSDDGRVDDGYVRRYGRVYDGPVVRRGYERDGLVGRNYGLVDGGYVRGYGRVYGSV